MKKRIQILVIFAILLLSVSSVVSAQESTTITLLHFSDYHSHALPFYSEGEHDMAGVARAIGYLKGYADDPNALILSGGDMINKGSPAWSDKYQCAEWSWFNGIVSAMAFGNHDADYGAEVFAECQAQIDYPILGSNVLDADGDPLFQRDGKTYEIFDVGGAKIGIFAVVGSDFERLLKPETMPAVDASFGDRVETAQEVVLALQKENVDAIVLIGHALYEDDVALAQAVPGIDLIFGTHSHRKETLTLISDTGTFIISPSQYLTYISKVEFTFVDDKLTKVNGELVKMDASIPADQDSAAEVARMQADLELDTDYTYLFEEIGEAATELSTDGQNDGEGVLGSFVSDVVRTSTNAHIAIFTSSGFRQPIPPGVILEQDLKTSMPYKNDIYVYEMTGEQLQELLGFSVSARGSDFFSQVSGVRFNIVDAKATNIEILDDPTAPDSGYSPLDSAQIYLVATSNFQGLYAGGYKDIFALASYTEPGLTQWDAVRTYIQENSPVSAALDGRMTDAEPPAQPTEAAFPTSEPTEISEIVPTEVPTSDVEGDAKDVSYLPGIVLILAIAVIVIFWRRTKRA